ncbi:MAG: hypothetical protein MZU95_07330 [Desulfomicrobium escambiense]|nr:hypothetical protein [Desulfomicrobium escambiense]
MDFHRNHPALQGQVVQAGSEEKPFKAVQHVFLALVLIPVKKTFEGIVSVPFFGAFQYLSRNGLIREDIMSPGREAKFLEPRI